MLNEIERARRTAAITAAGMLPQTVTGSGSATPKRLAAQRPTEILVGSQRVQVIYKPGGDVAASNSRKARAAEMKGVNDSRHSWHY